MTTIKLLLQGSRIDFQREGAKIILNLVSPGGASTVDAGGENFILWFSRTQQYTFLDAYSKDFIYVPQMFFAQ